MFYDTLPPPPGPTPSLCVLLVFVDRGPKRSSVYLVNCLALVVFQSSSSNKMHIHVHFPIAMPLSLEQREAMDVHIRRHTHGAEEGHGVLTFRTYMIDSIERAMDSSSSRIRSLALSNSTIACHDKAFFWRTLAEIASESADVDWHGMEYGEPLGEADCMARYVYTWCCKCSVLKFYTKVVHGANRRRLEWFVCKLTADEDHSGEDTDLDGIF